MLNALNKKIGHEKELYLRMGYVFTEQVLKDLIEKERKPREETFLYSIFEGKERSEHGVVQKNLGLKHNARSAFIRLKKEGERLYFHPFPQLEKETIFQIFRIMNAFLCKKEKEMLEKKETNDGNLFTDEICFYCLCEEILKYVSKKKF